VAKRLQNWLNAEWAFTKMVAPIMVVIITSASIALVKLNWNMSQSLVKIEASITPIAADVESVKIEQKEINGRVGKVEQTIENVRGQISVIKTDLQNFKEASRGN
jgi:predicted  nucleic acid-binding Zn-ribbon protein